MLSSLLVPTLEENWSFSPGTAELQRALTLEKLGQSLRTGGVWKWNILFFQGFYRSVCPLRLSNANLNLHIQKINIALWAHLDHIRTWL